MKITIVGGGNVGTQIAVHCAEKNHDVIIYGSKPQKICKELEIVDANNHVIHKGSIKEATNYVEKAFLERDLIFITVPAFNMDEMARLILPFCYPGLKICIVPGTGGGECSFKKCIDKGAIVIGLERVPSVARLIIYGKRVCASGYRNKLKIATLPKCYLKECCQVIGKIFDMECEGVAEYLSITMTPSNPILHTTRLYTLFRDFEEGTFYEEIPLFYEEWDNETSELLIKCDEEVQNICRKIEEISKIDLSNVISLKKHYESYTTEEMTNKISSIAAFKGIKTPVVKKEECYIPDLNSRYFTADFPYGLSILIQLAQLAGVEVKNMEQVMNWYNRIGITKKGFEYSDYGIKDLEDLIKVYKQ